MKTNFHTYKINLSVVELDNTKSVQETYDFLRTSRYYQYLGLGLCSSSYWSLRLSGKSKKEVDEIMKPFTREPGSKLGSAYPSNYIFGKGLSTASNIYRTVSTDCENAIKNGKKTVIGYKKNSPIFFPSVITNLREDNINNSSQPRYQGIYHNYKDDNELFDHLDNSSCDIYMSFVQNILFKFNLSSNPYQDRYLRGAIKKIFLREYKTCDGKILIEKNKNGKGEKIVLLLPVEIPVADFVLDEQTVVGIDLGVSVPMYCALNNNYYKRRYIGDGQMLIDHYHRYKEILKKKQQQAKYCKGGHGYKRKMRNVLKLRDSQKAFTEKMCQKFAKEAIEFALKNRAKFINIEKLEAISKQNKFLSDINWPFYEMELWIKNQASKNGIIVRYVDPAYTSQTCSVCGNVLKEQRNGRSFMCACPDCKSHKMYLNKNGEEWFHADFNGARNIAMSINFTEESDIMQYGTPEQKKELMEKKKEKEKQKLQKKMIS